MKSLRLLRNLAFTILCSALPLSLSADSNQTDSLSAVLDGSLLPFSIEIEAAEFSLPTGLQAFAGAIYKDKWIFLAGRTNGLHAFGNIGNNFPPRYQNTSVYVVDPATGISLSRSLSDPTSNLSSDEIDALSATASQFFQKKSTLYIVGGYGINTATGQIETKSTLTGINLKKLLEWVEEGKPSFKKAIRQVSHPYLQVTGGDLFQNSDHDPFLLILGQNFAGLYRDNANGIYTQQIRPFWLEDDGKHLSVFPADTTTTYPDYRRRDLNVSPIIHNDKPGYVALAGVFTLAGGVWTVPVIIRPNGSSHEPDPSDSFTFKQAMNHYNCANFGLYSKHSNDMFVVLPGGISYGYFSGSDFLTDSEIPFINQVTTVKIDKHGTYSQFLMNGEYPYITSTGSNPGNQLLFGAEALFLPAKHIHTYDNGVIDLDKLDCEPITIGYIIGGVMSTLGNTESASDSTASPYVFKVKLRKK